MSELGPSPVTDGEDYIDLGRVFGVVRRGWRVVAIFAMAAAVVYVVYYLAAAGRFAVYSSDSTILLTGSRYKLTLDPKFTTNDQLTAAASRADEYKLIALSEEVWQRFQSSAANELGRPVPSDLRIDVKTKASLIIVTASTHVEDQVSKLAAIYALAAANRFEEVYGQTDQDIQALQRQLDTTIADQKAAELELATDTRTSKRVELQGQLDQKNSLRLSLLDQQRGAFQSRFASYYAAIAQLDALGRDAAILRQQVANAGQSSASQLAQASAVLNIELHLINLGTSAGAGRSESLTLDKDGRATVSLAPSLNSSAANVAISSESLLARNANREQMISDIDSVIKAIGQRQSEFVRDLQSASDDLAKAGLIGSRSTSPGVGAEDAAAQLVIDQLGRDILELQAQVNLAAQKSDALIQTYDQLKQSRATLASKLQEAQIASTTAGAKALVVSGTSTRTFPPPLLVGLPVMVLVGIVVGLAVVFVRDTRSQSSNIQTRNHGSVDKLAVGSSGRRKKA